MLTSNMGVVEVPQDLALEDHSEPLAGVQLRNFASQGVLEPHRAKPQPPCQSGAHPRGRPPRDGGLQLSRYRFTASSTQPS